jgi:hypothetical protein
LRALLATGLRALLAAGLRALLPAGLRALLPEAYATGALRARLFSGAAKMHVPV